MYKLLLCSRYLRTRFIALASIISVMLGVATMIVVNSVMSGFATQMKERIHGILADMVVEVNTTEGVANPEEHMRRIQAAVGEQIEAMSPTVEVYGMISFKYAGQWITRPVTLIGIDAPSKARVGTLVDHLMRYQELKRQDAVAEADWELTPEDAAYRRRQAEALRWVRPELDEGGEAADDDPESEPAPDEGNSAMPEEDPTNPFGPTETVAIDPARPLRGRLYVGLGLVSYLTEYPDPESNKPKTRTEYMVRRGDDIKVSTVSTGQPPAAIHFNATVVDYFKSGMSEYDANLVFVNLDFLQDMRAMVDPETGERSFTTIQIKLKDYRHAEEVVNRLRMTFPPGLYSIKTWEDKQGPLLAAVAVESAILNVLLFMIIAVAGFGILAIFYMIVVEKTRDIGILKALGASANGVMSVFLGYGLGLGLVGAGVGVLLGLEFVWYINEIEAFITWLTGHKVFDDRIYYFPEIPTNIEPAMVLWVAAGAMAVAVLSSILPARRAALLRPVEALRYE